MQVDWLDILYKVFEVAIVPILGVATGYLVTLLKAKKEELLIAIKNENVKKYLDLLDNTITECILATNQTYVDALKAEGSFDKEAQQKAFQLTCDAVKAIISDDAQLYLNEAVKDLDAYIANKIESQILTLAQ